MQERIQKDETKFNWGNGKTSAEIDFIVQHEGRVVPIEVKGETNVRSKSLAQFIKDNEGFALLYARIY